jgi:lipoate-protein ligase A
MLYVREYTLKDSSLIGNHSFEYSYLLWSPEETSVIIGRGNDPVKSLNVKNIDSDGVPVYKRPSGGEAVVISQNTLIISIADNRPVQVKSPAYFHLYNNAIIHSLESLSVRHLSMEGISDIALAGRKILGCSIYRNKKQVFYHAVLNVSEPAQNIAKYLLYPKKTPAYRAGRDHAEFITSLAGEGYIFSSDILKRAIALNITSPA